MACRIFMICALVLVLVIASGASPLPKLKGKIGATVKAGKTKISISVNLFSGLATWFTPNKGGIEGGPLGE
jgi:hypothetical protein